MISVSEKWAVRDRGIGRLVHLAESPPEIIVIIRILTGTVSLNYEFNGSFKKINLYENYIRHDEKIKYGRLDHIFQYIFEDLPSESDLSRLINSIKYLNMGFYRELRQEISYAVFSLNTGRFTESFLYLYRTLERISAACALIFVSREIDFRSAHHFLEGIFSEAKKMPGELKTLENFLLVYSKKNEMFRDATLEIPMFDFDPDLQKRFADQWSIILDKCRAEFDSDSGSIRCKYKDVSNLVISIRNRSFHNEGGRKNIDFSGIGGSEPFFGMCVEPILRWFSYLFVDFAKWQIEAAQRLRVER